MTDWSATGSAAAQEAILDIAKRIGHAGGRALLAGGAVRDFLLGRPAREFDLEIFGVPADRFSEVVGFQYRLDPVGRAYPILKVVGLPLDVSFPCREFRLTSESPPRERRSDPAITPQEAAARRDFTINAMYLDPLTGELLDPFNGRSDLEQRILRHTSLQFGDDPLRVLRGFQLIGRFTLNPADGTVNYAKGLFRQYDAIPIERIWGEWSKWAGQSVSPSGGLEFLHRCGWVQAYPELVALDGCPQDSRWHPEGDVWVHTKLVVDEAARIAERDGLQGNDRVVLTMAGLCHDLGKPETTVVEGSHVHSRGHADAVDTYRRFLQRVGMPVHLSERVVALCRDHLTHLHYTGSAGHVRRLADRLRRGGESIEMLSRLVEADSSGRDPAPKGLPYAMVQLGELAKTLGAARAAPQPILLGRHLLDVGFRPGPRVGEILKQAYDLQLDGRIESLEEALKWIEGLPEQEETP